MKEYVIRYAFLFIKTKNNYIYISINNYSRNQKIMKQKTFFTLAFILIFTVSFAQKENYKVYPFKSASVQYKQSGDSQGIHTKYIEDYGFYQADYSETTTKAMGVEVKEMAATILKGAKIYAINFGKNTISEMENPAYKTYANSTGKDYEALGKRSLKSLGYTKTDKIEKILGKDCEIWEGKTGKLWLWQGLTLKSVTTVLGMTITEKAIKIDTDTPVKMAKFTIPKNLKKVDASPTVGSL